MPEPKQVASPDINLRAVRWGAFAIAGGIGFALAVAYAAWRFLHPVPTPPPGAFKAEAPLLQSAPQPEKSAYFTEKQRLIAAYGWVDRRAGIARIPVEEAMRLMAQRAGAGRAAAVSPSAPGDGRAPR